MELDFQNIWNILAACQPPEITHFQQKSHPGRGWWLKTCVPLVGEPDVYKIWCRIVKNHTNLVCITSESFDWNKNPIKNAASVWCRDGIDIRLKVLDGVFDYNIQPFENSFNQQGNILRKQLLRFHESHPGILAPDELTNLLHVAHLMCNWQTDTQAKARRARFKVVDNEKDLSQTHKCSELDADRVGK